MPTDRSRYETDRGRESGTTRTVFEEELDPSLFLDELGRQVINDEGDTVGITSQAAMAEGDATASSYQQEALKRLARQANLASRGEMTADQFGRYDQYQNLAGVATQGARDASLMQREARGQGGEDMNLIYQQMGQQQDAQSRAAADAQMQAGLADRAREMQSAYSQLARGVRGQSFNENYARGQAQDQASWFDADYQRTVNNRNTDRRNEQAGADAAGRQRDWENEARFYTGMAGESASNMRQNYADQRERDRAGAGIAQDLVDIGGGIAGAYMGGGMSGGFGMGGEEDDDDDDF